VLLRVPLWECTTPIEDEQVRSASENRIPVTVSLSFQCVPVCGAGGNVCATLMTKLPEFLNRV